MFQSDISSRRCGQPAGRTSQACITTGAERRGLQAGLGRVELGLLNVSRRTTIEPREASEKGSRDCQYDQRVECRRRTEPTRLRDDDQRCAHSKCQRESTEEPPTEAVDVPCSLSAGRAHRPGLGSRPSVDFASAAAYAPSFRFAARRLACPAPALDSTWCLELISSSTCVGEDPREEIDIENQNGTVAHYSRPIVEGLVRPCHTPVVVRNSAS